MAIAGSIIFHHFALWAKYKEAGRTEQKFDVGKYVPGHQQKIIMPKKEEEEDAPQMQDDDDFVDLDALAEEVDQADDEG